MLHLFYVSNYIAFNNYLTIIKNNSINLKDCIFYSPRIIKEHLNLKEKIDIIKIDNIELSKSRKQYALNLLRILNFKKRINKKFKNQSYELYIPHIENKREQILIANKNCKHYYFVEEGIPAYRIFSEITSLKKLSNKKIIFGNDQPFIIIKNKFKSSYTNHNCGFIFLPKKIIIPLIFKHKIKKEIKCKIPEKSKIILLDSPLSFTNKEIYLKCFEKLIESHLKNTSNIYIKYHPDFDRFKDLELKFNYILKKFNIEHHILPVQIYLEEISNDLTNNLTIYNLHSSTIIYCSIFGAKVVVYDKFLRENDNTYKWITDIMDNIISNLQLDVKLV